jgi:excisionase family DNA binding protein
MRLSRHAIRKAIENGELAAFQFGERRFTIRRSDLDAWLHGFRVKPENRPGSQEGARK